jgi:DNA-binding MarR family transcriptional regulator
MSSEKRRRLIEETGRAVRRNQNAVDLFDEAAAEVLGINRTDFRCLDVIDQHGTATAGELANELSITTGAVTALLDRLEHRGLVRRIRDDVDRRRVLVEITPKAKRLSETVYGPLAEHGQAMLAKLTDEQLEFLRDVLVQGTEYLVEYRERLRALQPKGIAGIKQRAKREKEEIKAMAKGLKADIKDAAKQQRDEILQETARRVTRPRS